MSRGRRAASGAILAAALGLLAAAPALGAFPYSRPGADLQDFTDLYLTDQVPSDLCDDGNEFKYSASPDPDNALINSDPVELGGVRGAHVVDKDPPGDDCSNPPLDASDEPTAFKVTLGRPDVSIAVLDSGIKWNDAGAMNDLRSKVRLNTAELPKPEGCTEYDCNGDLVVDVRDYQGDSRVDLADPRRVGPGGVMTPQDLLIAFSNGNDADDNGFVDDIAGWDFLDNDNDAFDDVQYGHGTGEASDSSSEPDNGRTLGACPNCTFIPLRVGDSFIADVNRFAQAVLYAVDNGILVVQEALGAINNTTLSRQAVNYAYRHGVTVIASAADEAAQHNNWPSSLPHVILVNSVRDQNPIPPPKNSYLAFNGCTNFNAKITLAIPSTSCSSNATGLAAGMAGLVYSAAFNARAKGALSNHPSCQRAVDGPDAGTALDPCAITPNEVRQLMASGTIDATGQADDVNFAGTPAASGIEPSCSPIPLPACTDPNVLLKAQVTLNRPGVPVALASYQARKGHDQFYGYGRVNMSKAVRAVVDDPADPDPSTIPPEVEITSPHWFEQVDPTRSTLDVTGQVFARGGSYSCRVYAAPGQYPNNNLTTGSPQGDFKPVSSVGPCDGSARTGAIDGTLAELDIAELKAQFPLDATASSFRGREPGNTGLQTSNGRPNSAPYAFTVKVVATTTSAGSTLTGEDQRASYLHRDQDMLAGYPRAITGGGQVESDETPTGDGESSPAFADLDGDNRNEMIFAGSDGFVHAMARDGSELAGWPVRGDPPALHTGGRAFESGQISSNLGGPILASIAVGDANRDGTPEVYAADLEGKLYGWNVAGQRVFDEESNPAFSGKPLAPFTNERNGELNRTQHGFIGSPVLADLDRNDGGRLEIIAAGLDRHVYAWNADGSPVDGYPVLVVDPAKVQSIDPQTHAVSFTVDSNALMQGAIVDTPAVADLAGDERPEIVVGTNEEYREALNAGGLNTASFALIDQFQDLLDALGVDPPLNFANSRLFAIKPAGDDDSNPNPSNAILSGWPTKIGIVNAELLPLVGEGVTGSPVIGPVDCPTGGQGPKIGVLANNGPAYIFNPAGTSCHGQTSGADNTMQTDITVSPTQYDRPVIPTVGHPAFGDLGGSGPSFLSPASGLLRALDVVLPEYQGGQDFVAAWDPSTAQFRTGFPGPVNDLQFLTGPTVADIDGTGAEEVIAGTASMDLAAFNSGGSPVSSAWPKLTSDWTVAMPLIGSWGTKDTDGDARKVVVNLTRSGYVNAYSTAAPACSPGSWPRFHHDNANSGHYGRDAVLPGVPDSEQLSPDKTQLSFVAPGDDLLCGVVDHYEAVTSGGSINASNFDSKEPLGGEPAPVDPGQSQTYDLPATAKRFVAIRAVDEEGNVGRIVVVDRGVALGKCDGGILGDDDPNVLTGTPEPDAIRGLGGDDEIRGKRGADCLAGDADKDEIHGGRGRDVVWGGDGDDEIFTVGGTRDAIHCGAGDDRVHAGRNDSVGASCENVTRGS